MSQIQTMLLWAMLYVWSHDSAHRCKKTNNCLLHSHMLINSGHFFIFVLVRPLIWDHVFSCKYCKGIWCAFFHTSPIYFSNPCLSWPEALLILTSKTTEMQDSGKPHKSAILCINHLPIGRKISKYWPDKRLLSTSFWRN